MNILRFSNTGDHPHIEKIFKKVREAVFPVALFNWPDEQIKQELILSGFYLSQAVNGTIQAFIAHRVSGDFVEIMALGTDPSEKQKGLMLSLLQNFVQNFSSQGLQVTLEVHERNSAAVSLYLKCGFKQVRVRPAYYKDGGAALVMTFLS
ncbi:MAG: GNAT family N-acetyltransferase [Bdellovibrionaceae bacterium]|nr:GNAT family N-acetyltransferase [Pseudobdellovibrionaceae bacterium]